jgi:two-component system sensor histidine kinase KdpD
MRRQVEYRGVTVEEMDVDAIVARHPQVAIVDELAHTNVPGSRHAKRWEDVRFLLDEGISVISAMNVQHLESLNGVLERELAIAVRETVPDWLLAQADQVVNVDLSAEDLRQRLREGKVYGMEKVPTALANFFTDDNLSTLRELALREVASSVDRSREGLSRRETSGAPVARSVNRLMVCLSSDPSVSRVLLRKASRIAGRLNTDWYCVYVQTSAERADRIDSAVQRRLVDNLQLAQSLGAEIIKLVGDDVAATLALFAEERGVALAVVGQSTRSRWQRVLRSTVVDRLIEARRGLDVLVVSGDESKGRERRGGTLDASDGFES